MDFYTIKTRRVKNQIEVYPAFLSHRTNDLLIKGGDFNAVYNEDTNLWSTDKMGIQEKIDAEIEERVHDEFQKKHDGETIIGSKLGDFENNRWTKFNQFLKSLPDNFKPLDSKIVFHSDKTTRTDYASKRLSYDLTDSECPVWEEIVSTLYDPEEREKIEWAIGSIVAGDSVKNQKFFVFYGQQGSGKSTIMNIVDQLFEGYCTTFKADNLVMSGDQFNLDFLADNPLVAIDEDANLSRIETNTLLNKIVSHEKIKVNEKFKSRYPIKPLCLIMLGTNSPVKITDSKSGLIRRLVDIEPSGRLIKPQRKYEELIGQVNHELGAIAKHCLNVYKKLGKYYYSDYVPTRMMYRTDPFFDFMDERKEDIVQKFGNQITGQHLWDMWNDYCDKSGIENKRNKSKVIEEARSYFEEYSPNTRIRGVAVRHVFSGLNLSKFIFDTPYDQKSHQEKRLQEQAEEKKDRDEDSDFWLKLNCTKSLLDDILANDPAQYEITDDKGKKRPDCSWKNVKTKLKDLDTTKTHFIKPSDAHLIFADFDRTGTDGKKSLEENLKAVREGNWTPTYAEVSNGGQGLHLYYWYDGDTSSLNSMFSENVEIKVFPEDQLRSIRRRVSLCNDLPIAHISSGLPLKEKKKAMIYQEGIKDEKHLRNKLIQALKKEVRPYGEEPKTFTCVKYIDDVLKNAQAQGMNYDLKDLEDAVYAFAANSHNHASECLDIFYGMEFRWPKQEEPVGNMVDGRGKEDKPIIILDCEVCKNVTLVVYKELEPDGVAGIFKPEGPSKKLIRMFNPKPHDIENLIENTRIVGHNVCGYDNYILWALYLGWPPEDIQGLSNDIIKGGMRNPFREAKNISYTDTLDVSSDKKGLKKIEIEMHIPHKEMEIDWDQPLPESEWDRLATYCENDVLATEAYFLSPKFQSDFKARKILAALTGMTVNDSTNNLTAQLIFGDVREPWHEFNYPDLKAKFPEYSFKNGKSYFEDVLLGEGGRVYAEEGEYYNVITFDVAGMHPTSEIVENGFGRFTNGYKDLYEARIAIKHKDYDAARKMFNGRLAPYLESDDDADALSQALKIALNSVYGMTAAHFQNRFKDPRNVDNWVAKRGALFMETLRRKVQAMGGHVIHIKTDSIKLVNPTKELQDFVIDFGKQYGYTFEVESKYERICLVNHAVYIALRAKDDPGWLKECKKAKEKAEKNGSPYKEPTRWTATGAQFAHPFVFKWLFSREPLDFWDYCETKTVKTTLYLDMNENLPDVTKFEKEKDKIVKRIKSLQKTLDTNPDLTEMQKEQIRNEMEDLPKDIAVLDEEIAKGHNYIFVGKAGEFMPIRKDLGGGLLMRKEDNGGYGYATGAKGYRWLESENMRVLKDWKRYIDLRYFRTLVDTAIDTIGKYCDFEMFVNGEEGYILPDEKLLDMDDSPWWDVPCGSDRYAFCADCPDYVSDEHGYSCKRGYSISNLVAEN